MVEALYEKYYTPLLRFCVSLTHERAAAEDIVQAAFLRVMGDPDTLGALSEPQRRAWLYKTAKNIFIDGVRRAAAAPLPEEEPERWDDHSRAMVAAFCGRLPEEESSLFCLRYFSGYNSVELGDLFGLSPSTVRAKLTSARRKLRAMYFDE
jgi:RNA polymerase sigma-70 factor (ECF subfamily)